MRSYCDPECEGRCTECPDTVIGDCARALEEIENPPEPAPQLELFGQPMVSKPLTPQQRTRLSLALQRVARKLDKQLERETGQRVGFSLVIWGAFGDDQMIQYVANADCSLGARACPISLSTRGNR